MGLVASLDRIPRLSNTHLMWPRANPPYCSSLRALLSSNVGYDSITLSATNHAIHRGYASPCVIEPSLAYPSLPCLHWWTRYYPLLIRVSLFVSYSTRMCSCHSGCLGIHPTSNLDANSPHASLFILTTRFPHRLAFSALRTDFRRVCVCHSSIGSLTKSFHRGHPCPLFHLGF